MKTLPDLTKRSPLLGRERMCNHGGGKDVYSDEEEELLAAVLEYRRVNHVGYVSCTDVLWILKRRGWRGPENGGS